MTQQFCCDGEGRNLDSVEIYKTFPLTDIQEAYWVGRRTGLPLGGVSTHFYYEIDSINLNLQRLTSAWQKLVDRHPMLRAIITPEGTQRILKSVPSYEIPVTDLRSFAPHDQRERLQTLRQNRSHQVLPSDQWPIFDMQAVLLGKGHIRLLLSFDALTVDERSRNLLLLEWQRLYVDPDADLPEADTSFFEYVLRKKALISGSTYQKAVEYWQHRLSALPPSPLLPLAIDFNAFGLSRFSRLQFCLDPATWRQLKVQSRERGLRTTVVVLAAFAETLKIWCENLRMTINLTLVDQMAREKEFQNVVGDFSSSLLLAVDNDREENFESRAYKLQKQLEKDMRHSHVSGIKVIRELIQKRGFEFGAIMPIVFTSLLSTDQRYHDVDPMSWLGKTIFEITQTPQVCLDYQARERQGWYIATWDVVKELFPEGMLEDMFNSHMSFLNRLATKQSTWKQPWPKQALRLVPPSHLKLFEATNATHTPRHPQLIYERFLDQSRLRPEKPAVIAPNRTLTYNELSQWSAYVANWLFRRGAKPNKLIGVVMEKGWEQIVAVLGVLRSGAAYLPIEPSLPTHRFRHLLKNCQIEIVLTQPHWNALQWPEGLQILAIGAELEKSVMIESQGEEISISTPRPVDIAYVIHTSGSTGIPKGVMITHQGAVNTIQDINERFRIDPEDRLLSLSSLSFDLSVFDIFGMLGAGGTIVLPSPEGTRNPSEWLSLMQRHSITIWNSVPALMELLVDYASPHGKSLSPNLRLVLLSGDWIPLTLPDKIIALNQQAQVISLGGATEASIWSILYPIQEIDPAWQSIPYGRPMQNQRMYILNDILTPRPVWVPGELYIAGDSLSCGYWRSPEETDKSFIIHPGTGERMYRTGDLGRVLPDGTIDFLGRKDSQVKIRGYRVELQELETILRRHQSVQDAVVVAMGKGRTKERLIAYVKPVCHPKGLISELHTFIRDNLPEYMHPARFVIVEAFPLTSNGKIDRGTLAQQAETTNFSDMGIKRDIRDPVKRIAHLVESVLGIKLIDYHSNLIDFGATSIDMIRIVNRIELEFGCRLTLREIYATPTATGLASAVKKYIAPRATQNLPSDLETKVEQKLADFDLIREPSERQDFQASQPGLRRDINGKPTIALVFPDSKQNIMRHWKERRSQRQFSRSPVAFDALSCLLSCLHGIRMKNTWQYFYASAGGLYPIQTYLYIKTGGVERIELGCYYYQPMNHELVLLTNEVTVPPDVYDPPLNRSIFEEAAFAIFFIVDLAAIAPMYERRSLHYAAIEAGLMSQTLEAAAPYCGLGLCQIGELDFDKIKSFFALTEYHELVHSLLGGRLRLKRRIK